MKKTLKRSLSFLLVLCMMAATCLSAFATDSITTPKISNSNIGVMINGNYVAFNAAAPKIINGRTMVPFRAILESLGATVAYDDATTAIAATLGDTSLKFKANDKNLAVTESGTTTNIAMDVLPYVDAKLGSTYVSARFVAQALGYNVSWDDYNRCVIIIDFAKMLNVYDKNFTILNKLFTSNTDMAKTYRMAMTLNMLIETGADSMGMKFAFDVLSKGNAIDGAVNGTVDLGKDATEFGIPDKFSLKIKMDPETYTIYLNSELFKELVPNWTDKTWISITLDDLTEIYAAIGIQIDFKKLLSNESTMTFDDLFAMFVSSSKLPFDTDSYKDISAMLKTVETLLGDKTFKTEVVGNTTTYTSNTSFSGIELNIKFSEKGGKLADYNISASYKNEEDKLGASLKMSGKSANDGKLTLLIMFGETKITYDINLTATESTEAVSTKPPAGDVIVPIGSLNIID